MMNRFLALLLSVMLFACWLCVPASAESLSGTFDFQCAVSNSVDSLNTGVYSSTKTGSAYPFPLEVGHSNLAVYGNRSSLSYFGPYAVYGITPAKSYTGTLSIAFSYYLCNYYKYLGFGSGSDSSVVTTWTDSDGQEKSGLGSWTSFDHGQVDDDSVGYFSPFGVNVRATFNGTENDPVSNPRISWNPAILYAGTDKNKYSAVQFVSFRVIESSAPSAEFEMLEKIASEIADTNDILTAMYGDILAVCNAIYQRTGSILDAQQLTNQYFSSIIPLIESIKNTSADIYSALVSYFDLVLKAIDNQTLTLEEAIQDAELALETYLKPMIDYFNELAETTGESASSLPQHKTDLDGFASDSAGIDADAQTGLASLLPVFTAFSFMLSIIGIFLGLGVFFMIVKKGLS